MRLSRLTTIASCVLRASTTTASSCGHDAEIPPGRGALASPVNVEIFSDVVCPWCAIGKRRFERALAGFAHADEVEIVWRAFELDPSAPQVLEGDLATHLAAKYGMSREQAQASQAHLTAMAEEEGLDFHFDQAKRANTFDAHRLLHYALEVGAQDSLKQRLFGAYFSEGAVISDHPTLVRIAEEAGLDGAKSAEVLASDRYAAEVRADEAEARALGISGVPFFVVDRRYGISGAQSPETMLGVLEEAWSRLHPTLTVVGEGANGCGEDSCAIG